MLKRDGTKPWRGNKRCGGNRKQKTLSMDGGIDDEYSTKKNTKTKQHITAFSYGMYFFYVFCLDYWINHCLSRKCHLYDQIRHRSQEKWAVRGHMKYTLAVSSTALTLSVCLLSWRLAVVASISAVTCECCCSSLWASVQTINCIPCISVHTLCMFCSHFHETNFLIAKMFLLSLLLKVPANRKSFRGLWKLWFRGFVLIHYNKFYCGFSTGACSHSCRICCERVKWSSTYVQNICNITHQVRIVKTYGENTWDGVGFLGSETVCGKKENETMSKVSWKWSRRRKGEKLIGTKD